MKQIIGYTIFWVAIGMLIMIFISNKFVGCIIVALMLVLGYYLYCKN